MIDSAEPVREAKRTVAQRLYGALPGTLNAWPGPRPAVRRCPLTDPSVAYPRRANLADPRHA
jgi:hypothetical protein